MKKVIVATAGLDIAGISLNSDSNFIADLNANDQGDDQSIANTIGTSGSETETL